MPPINPAATKLDRELKHPSPLLGCRFDPSGRFLFVSAQDATIQRYDLLTGAKVALAGHASWVRGLAFVAPAAAADEFAAWQHRRTALQAAVGIAAGASPPPAPSPFTLISADYHGKLIWWQGDAADPKPLRTVEAHDGWCRAVAVSPDGKFLASCGNDNLVKLWSAADGSPVRTLAGHDAHVYNVRFHPDGSRLASCDLKGGVKDWDVQKGTLLRDLDAKVMTKYDPTFMADIGGARGMAFAPDGRLACCGITNVSNAFAGVGNPIVLVFDWKDGKPAQLKPKDAFQGTAWGVEFHPAGFVIAAGGGSGGRVWFWKGEEPTSVHTINTPSAARDMALHAATGRLAVAGANGTAYVYALSDGPAQPPTPPPKKK